MNLTDLSICIQVFAREPVAGRVKTRLAGQIGNERAANLYRSLFQCTVQQVRQTGIQNREIWVAGDTGDPLFTAVTTDFQIRTQTGDDLGQRMSFAIRDGLARHDAVILIGSDSPSLDAGYLQKAVAELRNGAEIVLGPAEDGGYVLLGMSVFAPALFREIPWGTDKVLKISLERLIEESRSCSLLESRWDIDRPEDLHRLAGLPTPISY